MRKRREQVLLALILLAASTLGGGCTQMRTTDPRRTATEQFLLSVAGREAAEQLVAQPLRGRRVYVDSSYVGGGSPNEEQKFMIGELRAKLLKAGARLAPNREEAEIVVEVRSAGLGIDRYEFLVGIPSLPLGALTSAAGGPPVQLSTPELALVKNLRQLGTASIAYVAYWADTGELITSSGPFIGRSHREDWWIFGVGPRTISNIPPTEPLE